MNKFYVPAKLLLVIVTRGCGRCVVDASKRGGARGGTRLRGRGQHFTGTTAAESEEFFEQDIVVILMRDEAGDVINAIVEDSFDPRSGYSGAALVVDVPKTLARQGHTPGSAETFSPESEGEAMQSGFTMIASIINHGQAEDLMAVARQAGARGGTILNARGTGTEEDVQFFGISLAPEKEMLIIITESSHTEAVFDALSNQPVFSEPGGGIIFTTAVERFSTLGN